MPYKKRRLEEDSIENAKHEVKRAYKQVKPWVEFLSQFGFAARGVVYGIIGFLAALVAVGAGGKMTDPSGALKEVSIQPFGKPLLIVIAVGLIGHALWHFVQAALDPEGKGKGVKGIVLRTGDFISGAGYIFLVFAAWQIIRGLRAGSGDAPEDWTARVLAVHPYSKWLVVIVGAVIVGVGLSKLYGAWTAKFSKEFDLGRMGQTMQRWLTYIGGFGFAALGVVYSLIGVFLIQAAVQHNPEKAGGLGQAFLTLLRAPYGRWVLGIVAVGFIIFGIYSVLMSRYRRILV